MANWQRWLKYGKAKLDDTFKSGEEELARREAAMEAEAAEKPWLRSTGDAPTLDEVKARIEFDAKQAEARKPAAGPADPPAKASPGTGSGAEAFDFAEQQRQADERLEAIRSELGLDGTESPTDGDGAEPPAGDGGGPR